MTTKRQTILDALEEEMKVKIDPARGYETDGPATVKRGGYEMDDGDLPAIYYKCYRDTSKGEFGQEAERFLHIYLYGYAMNDGVGGWDQIHQLCEDVEYFLYIDFSYADSVRSLDINVEDGGIDEPGSMFEIDILIRYKKDLTTR